MARPLGRRIGLDDEQIGGRVMTHFVGNVAEHEPPGSAHSHAADDEQGVGSVRSFDQGVGRFARTHDYLGSIGFAELIQATPGSAPA